MPKHVFFIIAILFAGATAVPVHANDTSRMLLQACLKKAKDAPDMAAADAEKWVKEKGGKPAILCRATAQFNRGEYPKAADDFSALAVDEKDAMHAALLHSQAALAYARAPNFDKSEEQYGKALALETQDPNIWVGRANMRAAGQNYWEAIADLNKALDIMPDMAEALKLRGQVWFKLGLDTNAAVDFKHAAEIQAEEDVSRIKASRKISSTKKLAEDGSKILRRNKGVVVSGTPN
ncbi:MAG: tetratricopeptide repeat protein [Bdellovibrionales bacterium]